MKNKKLKKLRDRIASKPYHHIDACVVLGAVITDERFRVPCKDYLDRIGNKYRGAISVVSFGEIYTKVFEEYSQIIEDKDTRKSVMEFIEKLILDGKVELCRINDDDLCEYNKLRHIDRMVHTPELLSIAVAIREKASVFITIDRDILKSDGLRTYLKSFNLNISKPKGISLD